MYSLTINVYLLIKVLSAHSLYRNLETAYFTDFNSSSISKSVNSDKIDSELFKARYPITVQLQEKNENYTSFLGKHYFLVLNKTECYGIN
jgi:glucan biosynthesis protein